MKIAITGCMGRMGREVLRLAIHEHQRNHCELIGGITNDHIDFDLGIIAATDPIGLKPSQDAESIIQKADTIIDFTSPVASLKFANLCAKHGKKLVCGTTGFTLEQLKEMQRLAKETAIFHTANMSVGINLLAGLVEKAARILDEEYDIEILEAHHNKKLDAPSGTALMLGEVAKAARNASSASFGLDRNKLRIGGEIGYAVIRGGDIVGEHTVMFAGPGERIELTHKATDRKIFARGALKAAFWLNNKPGGKLYSMNDLLE
jgi:4-hydroxy-tetrahydrodipicolinate reductase